MGVGACGVCCFFLASALSSAHESASTFSSHPFCLSCPLSLPSQMLSAMLSTKLDEKNIGKKCRVIESQLLEFFKQTFVKGIVQPNLSFCVSFHEHSMKTMNNQLYVMHAQISSGGFLKSIKRKSLQYYTTECLDTQISRLPAIYVAGGWE